ncbi:MAG TPA: hypothetical protein VFC00_31095 [Micromonosporaceae bacterium]|nr:hypothetical protein [Micromonosporaceae bacterium]
MSTDPLEPILEEAAVDTHLLHRPELEAIGRAVNEIDPDEFIAAVVFAPGLSWSEDQHRPRDYFEIHGRHWWLDASNPDNRVRLVNAITAVALVHALGLNLSTTWVTDVLPTVVTVRSVHRDDTGLHFELRRRHPAAPLPPHLADTVNPDDYAEFVYAIEQAQLGEPVCNGRVTIEFTGHDAMSTDKI